MGTDAEDGNHTGTAGWSTDYLALRKEMTDTIDKQDKLFVVSLTAFGVMVAIIDADADGEFLSSLLWLSFMVVVLILQSKVLHYRDTVHRIGSYLESKETSGFLGYRWESEFKAFRGLKPDASAECLTAKITAKVSRLIRSFSLFFLMCVSFLMLVPIGQQGGVELSGWVPIVLGAGLLVVGLILARASYADKDMYIHYCDDWKKAIEESNTKSGERGSHE